MQNRIEILSTRPLHSDLVAEAKHAGIDIEQLSFIETEPVQSIMVQRQIAHALLQKSTAVFTSMNAVDAVARFKNEKEPDWRIYCTGTTTNYLVGKYFGEQKIAGTANDAGSLATLIAADSLPGEVIFFCGDQRREELPGILRSRNIIVNEVIVYKTIAVPHKINKVFRGILFFSPSAVESFFRDNKLPGTTILFAIGNTTEKSLRKYSGNTILISDKPGKENLVRKMMQYFA